MNCLVMQTERGGPFVTDRAVTIGQESKDPALAELGRVLIAEVIRAESEDEAIVIASQKWVSDYVVISPRRVSIDVISALSVHEAISKFRSRKYEQCSSDRRFEESFGSWSVFLPDWDGNLMFQRKVCDAVIA